MLKGAADDGLGDLFVLHCVHPVDPVHPCSVSQRRGGVVDKHG